jgi:hypothetical protein
MVSADDILQDVLSGTQTQRKKEDQPSAKSLTGDDILNDALSRPSNKKETEQDKRLRAWMLIQELQNRPRPIRDRSTAASPMAALKAGVPTNRDQAIKIFAQERGIPVDQYALFPGGEIAYKKDDGNYYSEVPGIGVAPATSAAYYTPDVAEAVPSIFTGAASTPLGGPLSVGLTSGVSGATNAARQQLGNELAGEPDKPINKGEVALSFGLDALGQTLPFAVKKFSERKLVRDIDQYDPKLGGKLKDNADSFGIQLTPAELTNLGSLKAQQRVLGQLVPSSNTMESFYQNRFRNQISPTIEDFLNRISKTGDSTEAGSMVRNALTKQRAQLVQDRVDLAEPFYKSAYKNAKPVNVKPIIKEIDDLLSVAKGDFKNDLKDLRKSLHSNKDPEVPSSSLRELQFAKFALDGDLASKPSMTSLDATRLKYLTDLKNKLVAVMGKDNPDYIKANAAFEKMSGPLNVFDKKKPSSILKMSEDNDHLIADRIFDTANKESLPYIKQQISAQDPEAWSAIVRARLGNLWDKARKVNPGATDVNLDAGRTWRNLLMGDAKQVNLLKEALTKDQFVALDNLAQVLEASGRVKKFGSDTAQNLQQIEGMKSTLLGDVLKTQLTSPFAIVGDFVNKSHFEKHAETLAKVVTDPKGMQKLKELKKMSITTPKYWAGLAQLLTSYGTVGSNNLE